MTTRPNFGNWSLVSAPRKNQRLKIVEINPDLLVFDSSLECNYLILKGEVK